MSECIIEGRIIMSKIYTSADQLIGGTPLLRLAHLEEAEGLNAKLVAKLEYLNPAGSVKDRVAKAMLDDAQAKGLLKKDSVIIAYFRKYRDRSGLCGGGQRISNYHRYARDHERGTAAADESIWGRAGADRRCKRHEGSH